MQRFAQQSGGIVAAAAAKRGGAAFRFAADKALGDHHAFRQARRQLLLGQLGQRSTSGSARPKRSLVRITLRTSNHCA
jgi:hypothetical protein